MQEEEHADIAKGQAVQVDTIQSSPR